MKSIGMHYKVTWHWKATDEVASAHLNTYIDVETRQEIIDDIQTKKESIAGYYKPWPSEEEYARDTYLALVDTIIDTVKQTYPVDKHNFRIDFNKYVDTDSEGRVDLYGPLKIYGQQDKINEYLGLVLDDSYQGLLEIRNQIIGGLGLEGEEHFDEMSVVDYKISKRLMEILTIINEENGYDRFIDMEYFNPSIRISKPGHAKVIDVNPYAYAAFLNDKYFPGFYDGSEVVRAILVYRDGGSAALSHWELFKSKNMDMLFDMSDEDVRLWVKLQ